MSKTLALVMFTVTTCLISCELAHPNGGGPMAQSRYTTDNLHCPQASRVTAHYSSCAFHALAGLTNTYIHGSGGEHKPS